MLLTEANRDQGIDQVMDAVEAHRAPRATPGATADALETQREHDFLAVPDTELRARLEQAIAGDRSALLTRVRAGEVDPYTAALDVLGDDAAVRRLVRKP